MKNFKIIISPAKSFDFTQEVISSGKRPKYLASAKEIFAKVKALSLAETKAVYKLSDKKALEVFGMHQEHGQKLYHAIDLYNGLVYKQLDLSNADKQWVNDHVIILDALYGIIKPYDLIAPYRLDFTIDIGLDLKHIWKDKINNELKGYKIINLASKEFSGLIDHPLTEVKLPEGQVKKARGVVLNKMVNAKRVD